MLAIAVDDDFLPPDLAEMGCDPANARVAEMRRVEPKATMEVS